MIPAEENRLLTHTNPKTPAGELLRRYWQPVALTEDLPQGGPPQTVKIMGEDLVLFRDDQGRPGLLGLHCSHRGTDLSYGRIERRRFAMPLSWLALRYFRLRARTAGRTRRRRQSQRDSPSRASLSGSRRNHFYLHGAGGAALVAQL